MFRKSGTYQEVKAKRVVNAIKGCEVKYTEFKKIK